MTSRMRTGAVVERAPAASTPKSSAIVIWTLETKFRFQTGSSSELAKRNTSRLSTDSLPR